VAGKSNRCKYSTMRLYFSDITARCKAVKNHDATCHVHDAAVGYAKNLRKETETVRSLSGIGGRKLLTSRVDVSSAPAESRVQRCNSRNDSSCSNSSILITHKKRHS